MKLSFSFAKTAAPKRQLVHAQVIESGDQKREILHVSESAGIVTESPPQDAPGAEGTTLVIPCKSHYTRPDRNGQIGENITNEDLQRLRDTSGLLIYPKADSVTGEKDGESSSRNDSLVRKKPRTSILAQIREARARGEVQDAPDEPNHKYDAEEFAWGLLRGMGYDESKDKGPDVTKDVVGNRSKLGLGVKLDQIKIPSEMTKNPK
jgi:hypothetical protein